MAKKIAVFGDSESIKGFSAVGFDIYSYDNADDAGAYFRRIADSDQYAVIFITEEAFAMTEKEQKRYRERLTPSVIPIPGVKNNTGEGAARLSAFVEKAIGSDIIFNNQGMKE